MIIKNGDINDYKNIEENVQDPKFLRNEILNDFEEIVFGEHPGLELIKEKLYDYGAEFALMTGTGSTLFGIFPNLISAESAKSNFDDECFTFLSHSPN